MTQWHSGPPPSLGWWPCKIRNSPDKGHLRWWDGRCWSIDAWPSDSAGVAAVYATYYSGREIEWSARPDSWPERSRT
jgi:hypothetical protein